jgi:putative solute:sodium symporter small subunit
VASDLDEQTELGDVYLDGLMREQLRLSLAVLALTVLALATMPVLLALVPATRGVSVFGVGLPWLVLGAGVYPTAWVLARWYTRQAERIERDFAEVVEHP